MTNATNEFFYSWQTFEICFDLIIAQSWKLQVTTRKLDDKQRWSQEEHSQVMRNLCQNLYQPARSINTFRFGTEPFESKGWHKKGSEITKVGNFVQGQETKISFLLWICFLHLILTNILCSKKSCCKRKR